MQYPRYDTSAYPARLVELYISVILQEKNRIYALGYSKWWEMMRSTPRPHPHPPPPIPVPPTPTLPNTHPSPTHTPHTPHPTSPQTRDITYPTNPGLSLLFSCTGACTCSNIITWCMLRTSSPVLSDIVIPRKPSRATVLIIYLRDRDWHFLN